METVHDYETESVEEMLQALDNLDSELRHEYDEALELAPELVLTETKFMDFLRTDAFDATKAAVRFAKYWKFRKRLFEDRWLLPLDQTGRGALSEFDLQILRSGHFMVVTRPHQGPVLLYDLSSLPCTAGWASTRVNFYMAKVFAKEFSSFHGTTLIQIVTSARRHALSLEKEIITYCTEGLPVRVRQLLVAQSYEEGKELLIDLLAEQQARITEHQSGVPPPRIKGNSVRETLDLLETKMGVQREFLPLSLGGSLPQDYFSNWMRQQLSVEDPLSAAPVMASLLPPAVHGGGPIVVAKQFQQQQQLLQQVAADEGALVAVPQKKRKREMQQQGKDEALTLPAKRRAPKLSAVKRQNSNIQSLKEQITVLEQCNEALKKDNRRLEGFLGQARYIGAVSEQARSIVMAALGQTHNVQTDNDRSP